MYFMYFYETKQLKEMKPTSNEEEVLKTYLVREGQDKRINDVAWWERRNKKEVIQEALDMYLASKKDVPVKSDVKVA
jgi:hypothetical protein